ncbi:TetR/AcrR family transcriptional regulator C-terminal domain-containing protein [Myxococcus sp. K15C18031901]|uniref:TetR/AcrR family transcriptional regulator C-terminal domain-containing protein n=1 Tax=Myxococcus dinghuensis TaxID=2906761 RepID=UPI0020A6E8D7|nr:TetR/AcrR family transcriptional regulator C-terminal domain-containing protein [Myxococcus dinghuensis]MCP3097932.1 TetR/AcrR family transcriptional regulator C-terminal domain-containing protein [Myxococcus dinghuensis]
MKSTTRRPPLSRERILRAALDIVDEEGLEAISMRRLGQALGVEAMSLYNHVPNKAAILDGVFEAVLAELPAAKPEASWQAFVRARSRALRSVLRAHPDTLPLFATRPAVTPASIHHVETVLEALRGAGFEVDEALSALQVMMAFVVGHTVATHAPTRPDEESHPAYLQLSEEAFPRVRELARVLERHDVEAEFEFGLEAMVSGLEAHRKRRPPARR